MADVKKTKAVAPVKAQKKVIIPAVAIVAGLVIAVGFIFPRATGKSGGDSSSNTYIIESNRDDSKMDAPDGTEPASEDSNSETKEEKKNVVDGTVKNDSDKSKTVKEKVTISSDTPVTKDNAADSSSTASGVNNYKTASVSPVYSVYRDSDIKRDSQTGANVISSDAIPLDVESVSEDGKSITYTDDTTELEAQKAKEISYVVLRNDGNKPSGNVSVQVVAETKDKDSDTWNRVKDETKTVKAEDIPVIQTPTVTPEPTPEQPVQDEQTAYNMKNVWFGTDFDTNGVVSVVFGTRSDYPDIASSTQGIPVGETEFDDVSVYINGETMYVLAGGRISATSAVEMFADMTNLRQVDFSNLDLSRIESAKNMFSGCINLENVKISGTTSALEDTSGMFEGCSSLMSVDMSDSDISGVRDASFMFKGCSSLTTATFGGSFDSVRRTISILEGCPIESLPGLVY